AAAVLIMINSPQNARDERQIATAARSDERPAPSVSAAKSERLSNPAPSSAVSELRGQSEEQAPPPSAAMPESSRMLSKDGDEGGGLPSPGQSVRTFRGSRSGGNLPAFDAPAGGQTNLFGATPA